MKKITAIILSLCLVFGAYGITVSAENDTTVTVGSATASAGDTVKIDVKISGCEKFSSYTIFFSYDSEYVTAVKATKGINVTLFQPNLTVNDGKQVAVVGGSLDNVKENGTLATVEFKIADNYPGGVTEIPLAITKCKITEFNGSSDVAISSTPVDGKIVLNGAGGNVNWKGGEDLKPGVLTDDEAAEYTNPVDGSAITAGGSYYYNEETKKAVPATDVEQGIKDGSADWSIVEDAVSDSASDDSATADEVHADEEKTDWLTIILCIAGGIVIILAAVLAYFLIRKKK